MPVIYRPFLEKLGGQISASTYVGNAGDLFYDPATTTLRVSDGITPGGSAVSGGGSADLGDLKISGSVLGTQGEDGGWGDSWLYLAPAGEGWSGINIPSAAASVDGADLQIYNNNANSGSIQLTTHAGSWNFNNSGTLSFPNNTLRSESDTLTIENFQRRSQLRLDENNDYLKLSQWSGQRSDYFTSADWDTGTYVADEGGGYVTFTDTPNILSWLNSVPYADRISLVINDNYDVVIPTTGYSAGEGGITFYVSVAPNTSPTTVTSVDIQYYYESKLEMDYDDEEILLRGVDCDINITTAQAGNIDINSINNLILRGNQSVSLSNQSNTNPVSIRTDDGNKNWFFEVDGSFELPSGGKIVGSTTDYSGHMAWIGESSGDGLGYSTLKLVPSNNLESADQYIIIDPTGGVPGHIHIRAGGTQDSSGAHLYLGGENSYVRIDAGTNPPVTLLANNNVWQFGTNGNLALPGDIQASGNLSLEIQNGVPTSISNINSSGGWEANPTSDLATTGGSGTGLRVNIGDTESGYAGTITIQTPGTGYSNGDSISVVSNTSTATFTISVLSLDYTFGGNGELTFPDTSVQTGAAISLVELKALVANAATYTDFQTAIANL